MEKFTQKQKGIKYSYGIRKGEAGMVNITLESMDCVGVEEEWNFSNDTECTMHSIHAYPAKFPSFIAKKAFEYANTEGVKIKTVADVFCGCGTVALEAKRHGKDFWGCDINPVATLIAKVKSESYDLGEVKKYFLLISNTYTSLEISDDVFEKANKRLKYWYSQNSYVQLFRLKRAIENNVYDRKYLDAFYCLFSSILKASSRWLTKSIKPQIDPNKKEIVIWDAFVLQYNKFVKAIEQLNSNATSTTSIVIENDNFLMASNIPNVDLIISSPPYVTSYEYADLHQLSSLWLEYADDYRNLRCGTIGSLYNSEKYMIDMDLLNPVGKKIVTELIATQRATAKVRSVARYYVDIQQAIKKCSQMLNDGGMAFFVVGDTEYKGVKIKNSEHLIQSLINEGFTDIKAAKRRISNKLLTPYRDMSGRFSSDKSCRTIYHEEYIISGRMYGQ